MTDNTKRTLYVCGNDGSQEELHKFMVGCISSDNELLETLLSKTNEEKDKKTIVKYQDGTISILTIDGNIKWNTIPNLSDATEIIIGNTVDTLDEKSLSGGISLTSVTIPNSVSSIENSSFREC